MRREGTSIATIHAALPVAKSTISLWVRDIPLDDEHRRALAAANPAVNGRQVGQRAWSRRCREERRGAQDVDMLWFFLRFLRESYGVTDEALRLGSTATSATGSHSRRSSSGG